MSAKWGELSADAGLRDLGGSAGSKSNEDRPADAGAWPESMPMRFVAETSMTLPGMGEAGPVAGSGIRRSSATSVVSHVSESRAVSNEAVRPVETRHGDDGGRRASPRGWERRDTSLMSR